MSNQSRVYAKSPLEKSSQPESHKGLIQRSATRAEKPSAIPPIVHEVLKSTGQPLDATTRAFMEPRFGHDFSRVRVHTDARAAESAREVNAHAYTVGQDIVFGKGQYQPEIQQGKELLAHELTHTVQQSQVLDVGQVSGKLQIGSSDSIYERGAEKVAKQVTSDSMGAMQAEQISILPTPTAALIQRQPAPARSGQPPDFTVICNDPQSLIDAMNVVQNVRDIGNGKYTTEFRGKKLILTQVQLDELYGKVKQVIRDSIRKAKNKAENARDRYNEQQNIDNEHWITSRVVKAYAYASTLGTFHDPGRELLSEVSRADLDAEEARKALDTNNFVEAARLLSESETSAVKAQKMFQAYFEGIISGGEGTITVLEYTRDAAFITLGVLGTIATAGTAAGATTALGLEIGGTATSANLIVTGAPIVANLTETGVKIALGEKVDWGHVAVNVVADVILAKFGGKLGDGLLKAVLNNSETKIVGRVVLERMIHSAISHASGTTFKITVNTVYNRLKGKDITWEQFIHELVKQLSDPKGWLITSVMAGVTAHAEVKYGGTHEPSSPIKTSEGNQTTISKGVTIGEKGAAIEKETEHIAPTLEKEDTHANPTIENKGAHATPAVDKKASVAEQHVSTTNHQANATEVKQKTVGTEEKLLKKPPLETDLEASEEIERSFRKTFDQTLTEGPLPEPSIPPKPMSLSQVRAAKQILGKKLDEIPELKEVWDNTSKTTSLTAKNSRSEFNKHRKRFWRAVRKNSAARKIFEDAGFEFPKNNQDSAPVHKELAGTHGRISLDHIERRADASQLAVDSGNLRIVVQGDNTLLENIQQKRKKYLRETGRGEDDF